MTSSFSISSLIKTGEPLKANEPVSHSPASEPKTQDTDPGDCYRRLRTVLMSRLDTAGEVGDDEIRQMITELIMEESRNTYMNIEKRTALSRELFYSVRRLDILEVRGGEAVDMLQAFNTGHEMSHD